MSVTVVTVTNRIPTEPYYRYFSWWNSVKRFGVEPVVLGRQDFWHGLMTKPRLLRKWLREGKCSTDCMIFTDSWDVVFLDHPAEIEAKWKEIGSPWICGAEKNLFPPAEAKFWPECASPYRFLNSGVIISTPKTMLEVLEAMDLDSIPDDHQKPDGSNHHGNDQEELQKFFLSQKLPMLLDTEAKFVWNLCDVPKESYEVRDGKVFNKDTQTFPSIAHANGGAKEGEIFLDILQRFDLN